MREKPKLKKTLLIILTVVLSLIALVVGAAALLLDYWVGLLAADPDMESVPVETVLSIPTEATESLPSGQTLPTLPSQETTMPTIPAEIIDVEDVINIMLLGTDEKEGAIRSRSDSIILCTIKVKEKKICMTSFHRDTWVYMPEWWHDKLNAAYAYGSYELFKETMEHNFGLQIDHILLMEFEHFEEVIDILGGVDIELEEREANYLRHAYAAYSWELTEGVNRLSGVQALAYSRIRAIDSNWQRNERQKNVLRSIFQAYREKPILELLDITSQVLPLIQTYDLEKDEIYNLLFTLAPMLTECTVENYAFPKQGTYNSGLNEEGIWVIEITDMDANLEYLEEIIG